MIDIEPYQIAKIICIYKFAYFFKKKFYQICLILLNLNKIKILIFPITDFECSNTNRKRID